MKSIRLLQPVFTLCLVAFISVVAAKANGQPDQPQTALSLAQCEQQWKVIAAKFEQLEQQISAGDEQAVAEFEKNKIEAKQLIAEMETAAKQELAIDRTSKPAIRTLMGMAVEAATNDDDVKTLEIGDYLIRKGISPKYFEHAAKSEKLTIEQKEIFDELLIRQSEAIKNDLPRVEIITTKGMLVVELFENEAPGTVGNFVSLVEKKFYNGLLFHRVIEGFMAQAGGYRSGKDGQDENTNGPGYTIMCECYEPNIRRHFSGNISMAKLPGRRNSGSSEFFLTMERTRGLDGAHTVFGRIIEGLDVIESIERTHTTGDSPIEGVLKDKIVSARVLRKRAHPYLPVKSGQSKMATQQDATNDGSVAQQPANDDTSSPTENDNLSLEPPK